MGLGIGDKAETAIIIVLLCALAGFLIANIPGAIVFGVIGFFVGLIYFAATASTDVRNKSVTNQVNNALQEEEQAQSGYDEDEDTQSSFTLPPEDEVARSHPQPQVQQIPSQPSQYGAQIPQYQNVQNVGYVPPMQQPQQVHFQHPQYAQQPPPSPQNMVYQDPNQQQAYYSNVVTQQSSQGLVHQPLPPVANQMNAEAPTMTEEVRSQVFMEYSQNQ